MAAELFTSSKDFSDVTGSYGGHGEMGSDWFNNADSVSWFSMAPFFEENISLFPR
jgi:hypothetical protein